MHLRTSLVTAAAIVAAGLIGLSSDAVATTGTVTGQFKAGTVSMAGSTYGCTTGTVGGSYDDTNNPAIVLTSVSLSCNTPVGPGTISLNSGCTVPVTLTTGRTPTLGDIAIGGSAVFGVGTCVKISALFGICTANLQGNPGANFNETVKTPGNWQDLIFNRWVTFANQTAGCGGALTGTFTLNNIDYNVKPASGSINFL